jgi:hypothetical protein
LIAQPQFPGINRLTISHSSKRDVVSQYELTTPLLDSHALITRAPGTRPKPPFAFGDRLASYAENTFRILGLHVVLLACREVLRAKKTESKRIAVISNRPAAALASLLHCLPIGGCIVLIGLTRKGYYIGGELSGAVGHDGIKFFALQLAAKLHEITMVASLAEMVFSTVRREIISGRSVPFAALAAGLQFGSISYLWSKEFFSICNAVVTQNLRILPTAVLIIICSVLGVTVAPASATAMQPVLEYWPAGGTDIWLNGSIESLYPAVLDQSHVPGPHCDVAARDSQCPSTGWEALGTNLLSFFPKLQSSPDNLGIRFPQSLQVGARTATLQVYIDIRQPVYDRYTNNYTVSTAQHAVMAEALAQNTRLWDLAARNSTTHGETRFFYRQDAKYSMSANNALVHVRCHDNGPADSEGKLFPSFPDFGTETYTPALVSNVTLMEWIRAQSDASESGLLWVDLPPDLIRRTSLGAIVVLPGSSQIPQAHVWACSVDARWANTEITSDGIGRLSQGQPWSYHINGSPLSSWLWQDYFPRIYVRASFAKYLNPVITQSNRTVFAQLSMNAGLWGSRGSPLLDVAPAVEATLNLMVINGLVRLAPDVTVQGEIVDWNGGHGPWWRQFMPSSNEAFGWGGNAYNVTSDTPAGFLKAHMKVTAKGYAYYWSGGAIKASMAVLAIYVVIAVLHVCQNVVSGITSSSWDTPSEIIALAAKSNPPQGLLMNTGAGISKLSTLNQPVCIEAIESTLQLSFRPDRLPEQHRVKPNQVYG